MDCQKITEYYVEERYPFHINSELTEDELRKSLESAAELINEIIILMEKE